MSMELEKAMAESLKGQFYGLPQVDPWAKKVEWTEYARAPKRRVLALPPMLVRSVATANITVRGTILTLKEHDARPSLQEVLEAVVDETKVYAVQIKGETRFSLVVRARMIFYAAAKRLTGNGTPRIGRFAGDRDHSTVMSGLKRVQERKRYYEPEMSRVMARFDGAKQDNRTA